MTRNARGTPREQELAQLTMLHRMLSSFVKRFSRPHQRHVPLEKAIEHVATERGILSLALRGNEAAIEARRKPDEADSLGQ
jgi:hypothetical protein